MARNSLCDKGMTFKKHGSVGHQRRFECFRGGLDLCPLVYVGWSETVGRKPGMIINSGGLIVAI